MDVGAGLGSTGRKSKPMLKIMVYSYENIINTIANNYRILSR